MHHPFLIGKKVYLRGIEEEDLSGPYFQWLNDQESDMYTTHAIWPNSMTKMRAFFDRISDSRTDLVLAIIECTTDKHIGNVGLHDINWVHRYATAAILVGDTEARGKGYGTEAVRILAEHAFARLNLNRVQLGVRGDNIAAIRAYKAAGFTEEGVFRRAQYGAGKYHDVVRMARLCTDMTEQEK